MGDADKHLDPQDPLPEGNWLWRRTFSFSVTATILYFMWCEIDRIGRVAIVEPRYGLEALLTSNKWTIAFAGMMVTYYMLAPSAEQITKMIHTAALLRSGVQIAARKIVREADGGSTESASTVAKPPQPVVPPATDSAEPQEPDQDGQDDDKADDDLPPPSKGLDTASVVKGAQ